MVALRLRNIILICALLIVECTGFAQRTSYKSKIIDSVTKKPLPFVNIVLKRKTTGTFSDEAGSFQLQGDLKDSLLISHIGYIRITIPMNVPRESVELTSQPGTLQEVVITSSRKLRAEILGFANQKGDNFMGGVFQYALFIKNNSHSIGRVKTLYFHLGHSVNRGKSDKRIAKVRVRLYERESPTGIPGRDLLKKELVYEVRPNQKLIKVELVEENIPFLSDGIFVGLDVLGFMNDSGTLINYHISDVKKHLHIPLTTKFASPFTYINPDGQEWMINKTLNVKTGAMELANACFGVEVEF
jgi:hypothetical protein